MPASTAPGPQWPLACYPRVAHAARVYDCLLGGKDNFAVDRAAAEQAIQVNPAAVLTARANRAFLGRVTSYLAGQAGIRQFFDIGAGMPAVRNVHEVAQSIAPPSRVVYVDHDPIVLSHARALLVSAPQGVTDHIEADLREPERILAEAARTLEFGQPVAILLIAVLHLIAEEDDPQDLVRRLVDAVAPGSYVVISHAATDLDTGEMVSMASCLNELMAQPSVPRSRRQVARLFSGLDLLEPGLVRVPRWRPDPGGDTAAPAQLWGGVGRKTRTT
jgi:SAM-dependent methyltransferase